MSEAREHAGTASSVMGVLQSIANGIAAPLATSGGDSAVPMVLVMIVGSVGAWFAFWVIARGGIAAVGSAVESRRVPHHWREASHTAIDTRTRPISS